MTQAWPGGGGEGGHAMAAVTENLLQAIFSLMFISKILLISYYILLFWLSCVSTLFKSSQIRSEVLPVKSTILTYCDSPKDIKRHPS